MELLIRNKVPLACLVAALAIAWLGGLLPGARPGVQASVDRLVAPSQRPAPESQDAAPFRSPVPLAVAHSIATWRSAQAKEKAAAQRPDPFAYAPGSNPEPTAASSGHPRDDTTDALHLQGISISGDHAYAVVDRQLLAVGDTLGSWRVTGIHADHILLEGTRGGGQRSLPLPRNLSGTNSVSRSAAAPAARRTPGGNHP